MTTSYADWVTLYATCFLIASFNFLLPNVVKVFSCWCTFQPLLNSGLLITIKVFYFSEKIPKNFRKKIHTIICLRGWDSGGIIIHSIIMVVVICYGYFKCYLFFWYIPYCINTSNSFSCYNSGCVDILLV